MKRGTASQRDIRLALIEAELVDCMVALGGENFYRTQIPVFLRVFAKNDALEFENNARLFDGGIELVLVA